MVYKKRNKRNYRRYYRKGRKFYNSAMSIAKTARSAYNTAKYVASVLNVEHKYHDKSLTNMLINDSGSTSNITDLCIPAIGNNNTERNGDRVKMKRMHLRGHLNYNNTSSFDVQSVTIWVYIDKQNTISGATTLLEGGFPGTQIAPFAPKDKNRTMESKVLYRRTYTLSSDHDVKTINIKLPLNWHVQFEPGSTAVNSHQLKMLCISNVPAASGPPSMTFHSRVTYVDN